MEKIAKVQLAAALVAALGIGLHAPALADDTTGEESKTEKTEKVKIEKKGNKLGLKVAKKEKKEKGKEESCKGKEGSCKGKDGSCKGKETEKSSDDAEKPAEDNTNK